MVGAYAGSWTAAARISTSGVLLYAGRDVLPLADRRMLAVPLSELWEQ